MSKKTESATDSTNVKEQTSAAPIAETYGGSPVAGSASGSEATTQEVDLSKATITVPKEALTAGATEAPEPDKDAKKAFIEADNSFSQRAVDAGIGLIRVEGVDFRYVGVSPGLDKDPETESGLKISSANSTFTPLADVPFSVSTRVKDAKSGKFYYPTNATSWESTELDGNPLVPAKHNTAAAEARFAAKFPNS